LDFLGFPWILSTESRLINGLHEIFSRRFSTRFCRRERAVELRLHDLAYGKDGLFMRQA
jgi:hypothetical protein